MNIPKYILFSKDGGWLSLGPGTLHSYIENNNLYRPDELIADIRPSSRSQNPYIIGYRDSYSISGSNEIPEGLKIEEDPNLLLRLFKADEYFRIITYGKASVYHRYIDNTFRIKCLDFDEIYNVDEFSEYVALLNQCSELELKIPEKFLKL